MSTSGKEFVLTHVIKGVSSIKKNGICCSPIEDHFGVPWCISVKREDDHFGMYLFCEQKQESEWSIEVWRELKIPAVNGKSHSSTGESVYKEATGWGWDKFIEWEDMIKDYVIDDLLRVEIHVKIKKMTGINILRFDESRKQFSDVVLVVENQKFHVLKLYLASQSLYFEAMFLREFDESKKSEITLNDVKATDFHSFLELLYGENSIDDSTIDGILRLAEMYAVNRGIQKCEEFLMETSEKSLKVKLQLAYRYNLRNLKDYCLSKITTAEDIRSALTSDAREMDSDVLEALLHKSLALQGK